MFNKLVLATRNSGKLKEIQELLKGLPLEVVSLADYPAAPEVKEDRPDFAGNAVKKAESAAQFTGEAALADDSGLEVDALGGEPGVYSARYAGLGVGDEANNSLLLKKMQGLQPEQRKARFRCMLALALPGGETHLVEGTCEGRISETLRGQGGFGYDPLFIYEPDGRTFAEMSPREKNSVSHRAMALKKLCILLKDLLNTDDSS